MMMLSGWSRLVAAGLLAAGLAGPAMAQETGPVVFAAASLKNALDAINAQWQAETGKSATISYAASSALAQQIEQGAPADIFISADLAWMDYLQERDLIQPDSRVNLLGNSIVLVAPADAATAVTVEPGFALADLLGAEGHLAMADVAAVPAGKYGKEALESLGVWSGVEGRVAQAENVRAALALVAQGEAPLGIVYATDAVAEPAVAVVGTFPADSHTPIIYPAALTAESSSADAAAFLDYLKSDAATPLYQEQGFVVLGAE